MESILGQKIYFSWGEKLLNYTSKNLLLELVLQNLPHIASYITCYEPFKTLILLIILRHIDSKI